MGARDASSPERPAPYRGPFVAAMRAYAGKKEGRPARVDDDAGAPHQETMETKGEARVQLL